MAFYDDSYVNDYYVDESMPSGDDYGNYSDASLADVMANTGYSTPSFIGDNVPATQTASSFSWNDFTNGIRSFGGTIQDLGHAYIDLNGSTNQVRLAGMQQEVMASTAEQRLKLQKAKQDAVYNRQMRATSPISRTVQATPNDVMIFGGLILLAFIAARAA